MVGCGIQFQIDFVSEFIVSQLIFALPSGVTFYFSLRSALGVLLSFPVYYIIRLNGWQPSTDSAKRSLVVTPKAAHRTLTIDNV